MAPEEIDEDNRAVTLRRHIRAAGLDLYPDAEAMVAKHLRRMSGRGADPEIAMRFAVAAARLELERRGLD